MNAPLQPPKFFYLDESYARLEPAGEFTLDETVELIDESIAYCRENGIDGLLVDITRVTGFPSPSITDRFWFISKWAETAEGKVALAFVLRPEMITPDKIGITMATNRGLKSDAFTERAPALKWLQANCVAAKFQAK